MTVRFTGLVLEMSWPDFAAMVDGYLSQTYPELPRGKAVWAWAEHGKPIQILLEPDA